jgi:uncharacterized membrane protein
MYYYTFVPLLLLTLLVSATHSSDGVVIADGTCTYLLYCIYSGFDLSDPSHPMCAGDGYIQAIIPTFGCINILVASIANSARTMNASLYGSFYTMIITNMLTITNGYMNISSTRIAALENNITAITSTQVQKDHAQDLYLYGLNSQLEFISTIVYNNTGTLLRHAQETASTQSLLDKNSKIVFYGLFATMGVSAVAFLLGAVIGTYILHAIVAHRRQLHKDKADRELEDLTIEDAADYDTPSLRKSTKKASNLLNKDRVAQRISDSAVISS